MAKARPVGVYMAALVLAVAIPLCAVLVYAHLSAAQREEAAAGEAGRRFARIAAIEVAEEMLALRTSLDAHARRPAARALLPAACAPADDMRLSESGAPLPLLLADASGRTVCSAVPLPAGEAPFASAAWLQAIAGGRDVAIDNGQALAGGSSSSALVATAVRDEKGIVVAALGALVDLARLKPATARLADDDGGPQLFLVARDGKLLAQPGKPQPAAEIIGDGLPAAALAKGDGWRSGAGAGGVAMIYGHAPVAGTPWHAVVAMSRDSIVAGARSQGLREAVVALAIVATVLLVAAWFARRLLRPIKAIAGVAQDFASGNTIMRAEESGPRELSEIAVQLNRMLDERQRDDRRLRASEAKYRQLFETSNDSVLILDRHNTILLASHATRDIFGHEPETLVGQNIAVLQPERVRPLHARAMQRLLETGKRSHPARQPIESVALHRDGHEFPLELSYSYIKTDQEELFVGYARDISERRQQEEALRESEARFRSMADSSPALIWMSGPEGGRTYVNEPWIDYTGCTLEQAQNDGWMASVHVADRGRWRRRFAEAASANLRFSHEYRLRGRDGRHRWMLDQAVPRIGNDGRLAGYVGSCVDIHERVIADQRHRRLANLYAALSNANEAIVRASNAQDLYQRACDIVARYAHFRVVWIAMLEDDRKSMTVVAAHGDAQPVGQRIALRAEPDADLQDSPALAAVQEGRYCIQNDAWEEDALDVVELANPPQSTAAFPLFKHGGIAGVFVVAANETDYFDAQMTQLLVALAANLSFALDSYTVEAERNEAEVALRQLNVTLEENVRARTSALEAANSELEAFSYSVSHDLRAPLRSIAGFTDLLVERSQHRLDPEGIDYLQRVKRAAARMGGLIDDLLNLSRVSRRDLNRRDVDLTRIAETVVDELREAEPAREVEARIAPRLAARADAGLVQILLANLIGNAWKFSRGTTRAVIEVDCEDDGGRRVFLVRDNGIGFAMEQAERIFAPFARLHSEREFKGSGIGLAIVLRIVARHGGRVWAHSVEGRGATFRFTLGE